MSKSREKKGFCARAGEWKNLLWFRVSLGVLLLATLPLVVLAAVAAFRTGAAVYGQSNRLSTQLVSEISRNIQREIDALQNTSIDIAYSEEVQDLCINYDTLGYTARRSRLVDTRLNIAYKLTFNREVTDVILYPGDAGAEYLYGDASYRFRLAPEYEQRVLDTARRYNGKLTLFAYGADHQMPGVRLQRDIENDTASCLIVARAIRSLQGGQPLGVLAMRLNARFFNDRLRELDVGAGAEFLGFDSAGNTVLTTNETQFPTGKPLGGDTLQQLAAQGEDLPLLEHAGETYAVYAAPVAETGWTTVLLIPKANLDREIHAIVRAFLLLLALVLLLVAVGIRIFHRLFNRPLIRLANAMNAADGGHLHVEVDNDSADEIGQATRSFNRMLARIRQLLDDVKVEETAKRTAELAALQAQINPHFLSNTLGTARLMAQTQKADNIDQLLAALIELLHSSMDMSSDLIPLHEEIKYVQSYVEIMQYRQYNGLDVQYHIEPGVEHSLVPKLILQPLVENALTHGLAGKGQAGQVVVRAAKDENVLCLTVTDNGKGIPPEKLQALLHASPEELPKKRFSGIGLPNVNERVQRHFGDGYGLFANSVPGLFTTIEITLPIQLEKEGDADAEGVAADHDRR